MLNLYQRYCLPYLLDWGCGMPVISAQRAKLVPLAEGRVLEVGIGSARNLCYYDPEKVSRVFGLEPSEGMRRIALKRIAESPVRVEWIGLRGEDIPLENDSIDTVLLTYTLCSIADWHKALQQMRRVLKPSGKLLFSEHGLAPDERVARWQHRLTPVWKALTFGCHLDRPIPKYLEEAGFKIESLDVGYLPDTPEIAGYHYSGFARTVGPS